MGGLCYNGSEWAEAEGSNRAYREDLQAHNKSSKSQWSTGLHQARPVHSFNIN